MAAVVSTSAVVVSSVLAVSVEVLARETTAASAVARLDVRAATVDAEVVVNAAATVVTA